MSDIDSKIRDLVIESAHLSVERTPIEWEHYCQSPIERLMLLALWSRGVWTNRLAFAQAPVLSLLIEDANGSIHLCPVLAPQVPVGPYRVDFLIAAARPLHYKDTVLFAVECDGHDFHERTKKQAERDKGRDRYLASQGITVLRYTGSEIWRDAGACADDVLGIIDGQIVGDSYTWHKLRMGPSRPKPSLESAE